jgi:hypothetical protein
MPRWLAGNLTRIEGWNPMSGPFRAGLLIGFGPTKALPWAGV